MTNEQIEKFVAENLKTGHKPVTISFKGRNAIAGVFIKTPDFDELKKKNFWRIVNCAHLENYLRSKDLNHARMFNGAEFTKLTLQ